MRKKKFKPKEFKLNKLSSEIPVGNLPKPLQKTSLQKSIYFKKKVEETKLMERHKL